MFSSPNLHPECKVLIFYTKCLISKEASECLQHLSVLQSPYDLYPQIQQLWKRWARMVRNCTKNLTVTSACPGRGARDMLLFRSRWLSRQFPRPLGDMSTKVRRWMGETLGTRHSEVQEERPGHERENAASGEKGNWRQPKNRSQNTELLWPKLHGVLKDRLACGGQKGKPSLEGHWAPPVTNVEKRKQWKLCPQSLQPYNKGSSRVLQPSQYGPWQLL